MASAEPMSGGCCYPPVWMQVPGINDLQTRNLGYWRDERIQASSEGF
ncbi:MAG: hypothetical protein ACOX5R_19270 [bacterium]